MPMITASKFYNLVFSGIASGQSYSTHTGFRTRVYKSYFLDIRNHGNCQLRNFCFYFCRCSKGSSKRSEEHTSELQSRPHLVCRLLLEKKNATSVGTWV